MGSNAPDRPAEDAPKGNGEEAVRYKGKEGYQDLIMIMLKPKWTPKHWTGKFYMACLQGDEEPECCEHYGKAPATTTAYVIHVARRKGRGDWKILGTPKVWGFGDDKWAQYQTLLLDHCNNDFPKLRQMLIFITCQKTGKQKLTLLPYSKKDVKVTVAMLEDAKEQKQMFYDDTTIDRSDVIRSLADIKAGGDGSGAGRSPEEPEGNDELDPDGPEEPQFDNEPGADEDIQEEPEEPEAPEPEGTDDQKLEDVMKGWDD